MAVPLENSPTLSSLPFPFHQLVLLLTLRISQLSRIPPARFTMYNRSAAPACRRHPPIYYRSAFACECTQPMRKRIKREFTVRLAGSRDTRRVFVVSRLSQLQDFPRIYDFSQANHVKVLVQKVSTCALGEYKLVLRMLPVRGRESITRSSYA